MRPKYTHRSTGVAGIFLVAVMVLLTSCASSKKSAQRISEASDMVQKIEEVEAMQYANEAYREARIRLEVAEQLKEQGKHRKAMLKADEALAAAEFAEVKTLSQKANESLADLKQRISSLKEELNQYRQDQQGENHEQ
jgi:capsule polysaccharide export protein KpsE/RkpR